MTKNILCVFGLHWWIYNDLLTERYCKRCLTEQYSHVIEGWGMNDAIYWFDKD
jgi:hypothetical protein